MVGASEWQRLSDGWERLRWARMRWQSEAGAVNGSASDAARSLGMKDGTYRAYERPPGSSKHTPLDSQAAISFGRRFKVNWIWLLTGDGSPFDEPTTLPPIQERAIKAMSQLSEAEQKAIADFAEAMARRLAG